MTVTANGLFCGASGSGLGFKNAGRRLRVSRLLEVLYA